MTDEGDIIARVLAGDIEAFRMLVERYQGPVIRMIAQLTNDRASCEDIAQDVFLAAYRNLAVFDPACSRFSTWLFTIARNKGLNAAKKRRTCRAHLAPEPTDLRGPGDALIEKEFYDTLDKGLAALPSGQRTAFVLAEFEELPYETIAQIEGVRIGTVRSRINRAKKKLRSLLGESGTGGA